LSDTISSLGRSRHREESTAESEDIAEESGEDNPSFSDIFPGEESAAEVDITDEDFERAPEPEPARASARPWERS
jgi:hypothetical protein